MSRHAAPGMLGDRDVLRTLRRRLRAAQEPEPGMRWGPLVLPLLAGGFLGVVVVAVVVLVVIGAT